MSKPSHDRNEFLRSLGLGAAIGAVVLIFAWPWMRSQHQRAAPPAPAAVSQPAAPQAPAPQPAPLLANFGDEAASADARHVANWAFFTGDNQGKSIVILDKKEARVYTFDPRGQLIAATPALLGSAVGDDSAPGIGDKPLEQIRPEEKTTPAGRFEAQPGRNTAGEDIIWIDYNAAVSMHRVRPTVASERRLERLASSTDADNRISFGCVNLPVHFYEHVLEPTVRKTGAIVYVLPETRTPQEVFGSWDVTDPAATPVARPAQAAPVPQAIATQARRNRDQ